MSTSISNRLRDESKKPPAVFWRENANQFMAYIGYHEARKGKNKGKRVRTPFYFGRDYREAVLNAILIARRWDRVVVNAKRRAGLCSPIFGERVRVLPIWPTEDSLRRREATAEELAEMGLYISVPDEEGNESKTVMTIAQLRDKFLTAQQARIGKIGRRGLKQQTYAQLVRNLNIALKGIDSTADALTLTREQCRQLVDHWLSPERKITERTAANYCKAFLRMLIWADNEEVTGFRKPKIGGLFNFANTPAEIQRFDIVPMKQLLSHATERCRLYVLLALNTGYTQVDVANLTKDQIVQIGGETFLVRRRTMRSDASLQSAPCHFVPRR